MAQQRRHYAAGCKLGREVIHGRVYGMPLADFLATPFAKCQTCERAAARDSKTSK